MTKIYIPVPVSERLPNKKGTYFAYTKFDGKIDAYFTGEYFSHQNVTHWLEERELPSEEEIRKEFSDNGCHEYYIDGLINGANFIINKITKP